MSDTDTPAQPELVVCDSVFEGNQPHKQRYSCINPRPAQPEPPAPRVLPAQDGKPGES